MTGVKEKISQTMDKLTHRSGTNANNSSTTSSYGAGGGTGTGTGAGNTGDINTVDQTSSGLGNTSGTGVGTTSGTGATGYGATTGTGTGIGTETAVLGGQGAVIDSETFTKTEDHEVLIEKKAYELEHRPVQKQYVVETKLVGEGAVPGAPTEYLGQEAREVEERVKQAPHGDRTVVVENMDIPAGARVESEVTGQGVGGQGIGNQGIGNQGTGGTY